MYLFGGGHVGQALVRQLRNLDYHVTVIDDRPGIERGVSDADRVLIGDYDQALADESVPEGGFFVIATPSHQFDYDVLRRVLTNGWNPRYVGVVASKKKSATFLHDLKADLGADADLSAIYMPIGLDLGGSSADEIAVSIAAEIQAVRYGRGGLRHMRLEAPSQMILLRNCRCIATFNDSADELHDQDVLIDGNRIARIGPAIDLGPEADGRAEVIDCSRFLVMPGMVNTHHHMYQTLTRNLPDAQDAKLFDWLTCLYPIWAGVDEEAVYFSTLLATGELLKTGATCTTDHMYLYPRNFQRRHHGPPVSRRRGDRHSLLTGPGIDDVRTEPGRAAAG